MDPKVERLLMEIHRSALVEAHKVKTMGSQFLLKKYLTKQNVTSVPEHWLHNRLTEIDANEIFCHVGLSGVNAAFDGDPYEFLRGTLKNHFETIMAPGFTDYFEDSGVYHKKYSRPKHGAFARLLYKDAEYRTDDAIRSFIVDGPYRFDSCNHRKSYGNRSCFAKLEADNIPILNIGTPWLICSQLHHLEYVHEVPYLKEVILDGVMFQDKKTDPKHIEQTFGKYTEKFAWNRRKIRHDLENAGALVTYNRNGLRLMVTYAQDIRDVIGPKIQEDPYYLIT